MPKNTPETNTISCVLCSNSTEKFVMRGGYDYFLCGNCNYTQMSPEDAADFDETFYKSKGYSDTEDKWPQDERIKLFELLVDQARNDAKGKPFTILDFGAGSKDIPPKKKIYPKTVFYDPYSTSKHVLTTKPTE